jgi:hypothetical protein
LSQQPDVDTSHRARQRRSPRRGSLFRRGGVKLALAAALAVAPTACADVLGIPSEEALGRADATASEAGNGNALEGGAGEPDVPTLLDGAPAGQGPAGDPYAADSPEGSLTAETGVPGEAGDDDAGCDPSCPGTCTDGRCVSILASGQQVDIGGWAGANGISVNAHGVYWINATAAMKVPIGGGALSTVGPAATLGDGTLDAPSGVAVDGAYVFSVGYCGSVIRAGLDGEQITVLAVGNQCAHTAGMAIDAANVYWAYYGAQGTIMKLSRDGGTPVVLAYGQAWTTSIAVHGNKVYWTNISTGSVMTVPVGGGSPTTVATGFSGGTAIAIDDTNIYWIAADRIMKVALAGGSAMVLASGQRSPMDLAIDETNVYWTNYGTTTSPGAVMRVRKDGGTPVTVAAWQYLPLSVAVDGTSVYWTNVGPCDASGSNCVNGTIMQATPK